MRQFPLSYIATLAAGLRADSRTKQYDMQIVPDYVIQAAMLDTLRQLVWFKTKDGQHNRNRPKSLVDAILNKPLSVVSNTQAFDDGESFMAWRSQFIKKGDV